MFNIVSFVESTRKAIVAEANLRCDDFLFEKNVVTLLAVFLYFGLDYQTLFEFSQI